MKMRALALLTALLTAAALLSATPAGAEDPASPPAATSSPAAPAAPAASTAPKAADELVTEVDTRPGYRPPEGAHFNAPRRALAKEQRIENVILKAIAKAKKKSTIRISLFSWDRMRMADALIAARKRGVRVQILLNNHQVTPAMNRLRGALGAKRFRKNFVYSCHFSCRHFGRGENLHTKMLLFSHTGRARNVVMTGSFNFTGNSVFNQWNDLFVRNDDALFYDGFNQLWKQMRKDKKVDPPFYQYQAGKFLIEATPYPGFGPTNDPMMSILNNIACTGATTRRSGRTLVRVSMHAWNDARGVYLADKIRQLQDAGCDVRVMYGMAGTLVRQSLAQRTSQGFIPVHVNGYDTDRYDPIDGEIDLYSHQKYLIVDGNYAGNPGYRGIWTGSSNWNNGGMKGDELIVTIPGKKHAKDYLRNFDYIWKNGSHRALYIPYRAMLPGLGRLVPGDSGGILYQPELKKGDAWEEG